MRFLFCLLLIAGSSAILMSCALRPCTVKLSDRAEAILSEEESEPCLDPGADPSDMRRDIDDPDEMGGDVIGSESLPSGSRSASEDSKFNPSK